MSGQKRGERPAPPSVENTEWQGDFMHPTHAVRLDTRRRLALCGKPNSEVGLYSFDLDDWRGARQVLNTKPLCGDCLAKAREMLDALESQAEVSRGGLL